MFYSLALKNMKRSFRDYFVYFLTLTIAVCIFYSFNAIGDQKIMQELELGTSSSSFLRLIGIVSAFVALVLGGLIIYSNNVLISKRKKEFGIYMTLGMKKSQVSRMIVMETQFIGFVSLAAGLVLGVFFSQALSLFAVRLFGLPLTDTLFNISKTSIGKTALYYLFIFLVVILFNKISVNRYTLIELLHANKRNEELKLGNPTVTSIVFILSIGLIGIAYSSILKIGIEVHEPLFMVSIIAGTLGTLLFFYCFAGFLQFFIQKSKRIYMRGINIFTARQFNRKINTYFLSMTILCLMLFMGMTALSSMYDLKAGRDRLLTQQTAYDASIFLNNLGEKAPLKIQDSLNGLGIVFDDAECAYFEVNVARIAIRDILDTDNNAALNRELKKGMQGYVGIITATNYNILKRLLGEPAITLSDNQVAIISNYNGIMQAVQRTFDSGHGFILDGNRYFLSGKEVIETNLFSTDGLGKFFYLIVPDTADIITTGNYISGVNLKFIGDHPETIEQKYSALLTPIHNLEYDTERIGVLDAVTREQVYASAYGQIAIIIFLGIYIGLIFLIASAAILALQQLTDTGDNRSHYEVLKKLGVSKDMINRSLLIQTLQYFLLPVFVALIHTFVGVYLIGDFFSDYMLQDAGISSFYAVLILLIIYGGYFYATYSGCKRIIQSEA